MKFITWGGYHPTCITGNQEDQGIPLPSAINIFPTEILTGSYTITAILAAHACTYIKWGPIYYWWGGTKSTRYCGHFWSVVPAPDDR
jgi:hypothetical protein